MSTVSYKAARGGVLDGDVLLFQGSSLFSRAISWVTRSSYTHAAMAVWVRGRLMAAESRESKGTRLVPLSTSIGASVVHQFRPVPWVPWSPEKAADAALLRLGRPYGWWSILRTAAAWAPMWVLRRLPIIGATLGGKHYSMDDLQDPGTAIVCSSFVSVCMRAGGVDLVPRLSDRDTTPGDLARSGLLSYIGAMQWESQ